MFAFFYHTIVHLIYLKIHSGVATVKQILKRVCHLRFLIEETVKRYVMLQL